MENTKHKLYLAVKDHSVSKEAFELYHDFELDLLFTHPKPEGEELSRYYESDDYISHTDGKRSVFEKIYQFIKGIALKNKLRLLNSLQKPKGRLLDIGAGTGDFLATAKSDNWDVIGIEPSSKAKQTASKKGVAIAESTSEFPNQSFNAITMWHVLEHVPDLQAQFTELKRLLKPEGVILIAVPNFKSHDAKVYGEHWAAYDVPRHLWHFSKTSITKLAQQHDLQLIETLPMPFDAYYVSLLSEKYRSGSMNPVKAMLNGLKSNAKARKTGEYSSLIYVIRHTGR